MHRPSDNKIVWMRIWVAGNARSNIDSIHRKLQPSRKCCGKTCDDNYIRHSEHGNMLWNQFTTANLKWSKFSKVKFIWKKNNFQSKSIRMFITRNATTNTYQPEQAKQLYFRNFTWRRKSSKIRFKKYASAFTWRPYRKTYWKTIPRIMGPVISDFNFSMTKRVCFRWGLSLGSAVSDERAGERNVCAFAEVYRSDRR